MRASALLVLLLTGCYVAPEDLTSRGGSRNSILPAGTSNADAGHQTSESEACDAGVVAIDSDAGAASESCDPAEAPAVVGQIPGGLHESAVFWDGKAAVILGGMTSARTFSTGILRFDPSTHSLVSANASLPTGKQAAAIASSGTRAWLFGGRTTETTFSSEIVAFDSSTDQVTVLPTYLPSPRYNEAAVWADGKIFIFGGYDGNVLRQVVKFDPATNTVSVLAAQMPEPREQPVAVFTGTEIVVAGGWTGYGTAASILRFDPVTESFSAEIPVPEIQSFSAGAYAAGKLFMLGGTWPGGASGTIVSLDPGAYTGKTLTTQLPVARVGQSALGVGCHLFTFGGADSSGAPFSAVQSIPVGVP